MSVKYRIYVTPLVSPEVYGSEVEISDWVDSANVGQITRSIDSTDFTIGLYTYSDISIDCDCSDGYLSYQGAVINGVLQNTDSRSIFKYKRDLAKVRIVYDNDAGSPPVTFKGLLSEDGTTLGSQNQDVVTLCVLGKDSVFQKSLITAGTITDGMTIQQALEAILGSSDITAVLNVSTSNINPYYNATIDLGSKFDNVAKSDAINQLLLASDSVLIIDPSDNLIIQGRLPNTGNPTVYLYGKGDRSGKENILQVTNYNTGLQRLFNSFVINGGQASTVVSGQTVTQPQSVVEYHDPSNVSIGIYGLRQKTESLEWLTDPTNITAIATALVVEFQDPKIELQLVVPTDVIYGANLLDQVSISYPLLTDPAGKFLPIVGVTVIGDVQSPLPYVSGAFTIDPSVLFKLIEIQEDPASYTSTIKVRQI